LPVKCNKIRKFKQKITSPPTIPSKATNTHEAKLRNDKHTI